MVWIFFVIAGCISLLLTSALRRYALSKSLIDVPNARSSHTVPTPRGGGVAIVLSFLLLVPLLSIFSLLPWASAWGLIGAGAGVAVLGFLDDHGHIAARWRLLGHFSAAVWALFWLGGIPPLTIMGVVFDMGWIGVVLSLFYLVWMLNLYNFMDGIDGLASVEAIAVCLSASLIYVLMGFSSLAWAPLLLSFTVAGFLYWNFPPAKIFMGDAGSGFLGVTLGILSLQAAWASPALLWVWVILMGVFVVDATFTLVRRLVRGDKVYEAHRSHAYQYASRQYRGHFPVTVAVSLINIFWLLPLSVAVSFQRVDPALGLIIAYIPLLFFAVKYKAGEREVA